MQIDTRIAVLGGTGKSGRYLVRSLIQQEIQFKLLVRNTDTYTLNNQFGKVVHGNARELETIRLLLKGCDTVISCLGSGIPPSEPTIFSKATQNVLTAMEELGIDRYIVLTGLNVNTPCDQKGMTTKTSTDWMYQNFPVSTKDRQKEYDLLDKSETDWTLVRLPLISLTDEHTEIETSLEDCKGGQISAGALANFLVRQVSDGTYVKKAPFVFDK